MNVFSKVTLEDLCRKLTDGTHDSPKLLPEGVPFVKGKHISGGVLDLESCDRISHEDHLKVISRSKPENGDTLFSNIGSVGDSVFVNTDAEFSIKNVALFKPDPNKVMPKYLFYLLRSPDVLEGLLSQRSGSAQPFIGLSTLRQYTVKYHSDLTIQSKVVSILSAYDDLIENNTRRIEILEEMARRLYEEWFVHFRFPGHEDVSFKESELGEIPKGWEVCKLIDLVDFIGGAQPPKSQHIYEEKEGYIRFVQNRDYRSDGHLTYIPESKRNKICGRLDILVDKYGEAGKARFGIAGAYNVALAKIVPKNESYREWLRGLLSMTQTQEYLLGASQAATRPSLNKAHLNFPVVLPSESVAERFGHQVLPMLQLILALKDKTANLRAQRDLLLPKLVSGEIDVSDIPMPEDKEVEAA